MVIRILFVIPYNEIQEKVKNLLEVYKEDGVQFETTHVIGTREALVKDTTADIVIARGITCMAFKKNLKNVSVVEIEVTGYDIIRAVQECKTNFNAKSIALIAPESAICETESVQEIMNVDIKLFKIYNEKDALLALQQAKSDNVDAIVGGLTVCKLSKKMKFNCARIQTGEEALIGAIKEALNAAHAARLERNKAELFKMMLQNTKEAIVAVDKNGIITEFNSAAYKTLKISQNRNVKGEYLKTIIPDGDLLKPIRTGEEDLGVINKINETVIMSNRIPIKVSSSDVTGILYTFQNVDKIQEMESKIRKELNRKGLVAKYSFGNIIGKSKVLSNTIETAYKYSQVDSNILLIGETGTGKELFVQSIHNASSRTVQPFVAINCAAVPENLLESELFGYAEGAFSGAVKGGKTGLFELAHKGTIFLDEIGELSLNLQAKLLRVLQEKEVRRVGDDKVIHVDVRVISATNKELAQKVEKREFRQDLLYRLDILSLRIPPLRERKEDIVDIAEYFIEKYCIDSQKPVPKLADDAVEMFKQYSWPGNVRELRNICERIVVLWEKNVITKEDVSNLPIFYNMKSIKERSIAANYTSEQIKIPKNIDVDSIDDLIDLVKINKSDLAKMLGISRTTLWRKLKDKSQK